ncbi:MAG: hypothetical protein HYZ81_21815, partial [Nitrospinae bacterium]|nr:hypothetical protein [Nitrospinota bacterium]
SSVVLVDLHPHFGDVALFLDIEPAHTLGDIAQNMARLDATFLMSILARHSSGLYLLPSVNAVEQIGALTAESAERTLELLQASFDYIIIDSGHALADVTLAGLNMSPTILLVSTLTLPVLRNTKRLLDILSHLSYPTDSIKIIVNRYERHTEVSLKDMESVLKRKVFWLIPNDYFTTMNAINKGKPVSAFARRADITKSFHKLTLSLTAEEGERKKASSLAKLFTSK